MSLAQANTAAPSSTARLGSLQRASSHPQAPDPDCGGDRPGTGRRSCGQSPDRGRDPRIVLGA